MFRYRLRTLLIVLALGPAVLAGVWHWWRPPLVVVSPKPLLYSAPDVARIERRAKAVTSSGLLAGGSSDLAAVLVHLGLDIDPPPSTGREWGDQSHGEWLPLSRTHRLVVQWSVMREGHVSDSFIARVWVEDVTKMWHPLSEQEFEAVLDNLFSPEELHVRKVAWTPAIPQQ